MSAPEPLTPHERALAATLPVSLVRHEDRFGYFEDRDPAFVTAVVLTEDEARTLVSRRPLPVSGGDGSEYAGPHTLLECYDHGSVTASPARAALRSRR